MKMDVNLTHGDLEIWIYEDGKPEYGKRPDYVTPLIGWYGDGYDRLPLIWSPNKGITYHYDERNDGYVMDLHFKGEYENRFGGGVIGDVPGLAQGASELEA